MKLVTLEGYNKSLSYIMERKMNHDYDDLDTVLGNYEDEFGLGAFKKLKKKAKKAVKKAVPKVAQKAIKKAVPKSIQKLAKKGVNLVYNPVAQAKMLKKIANKAAPIIKQAMKTAQVVVPIAAMSLGLPPSVTGAALQTVFDLASGEGLTLDNIKGVAEQFGIPADKLQIASELINANTPDEREKIVNEISSENPEAGKLANDMKNRMNETESVIEEKVNTKIINTPQFLTKNSIALKLFNQGRLR